MARYSYICEEGHETELSLPIGQELPKRARCPKCRRWARHRLVPVAATIKGGTGSRRRRVS